MGRFTKVCRFRDFILLLEAFLNLQNWLSLTHSASTEKPAPPAPQRPRLQNRMPPFPPSAVAQIHEATDQVLHAATATRHALPGPQLSPSQGNPPGRGGVTAAPGRRQPAEEHVCATREAEKRQRGAQHPALQKVRDTLPTKVCCVNTEDISKFFFLKGGREDCCRGHKRIQPPAGQRGRGARTARCALSVSGTHSRGTLRGTGRAVMLGDRCGAGRRTTSHLPSVTELVGRAAQPQPEFFTTGTHCGKVAQLGPHPQGESTAERKLS